MDADAEAMKRRDEAAAKGAQVCPDCEGSGTYTGSTIDHDQVCAQCAGETWIDAQGCPYKIDPAGPRECDCCGEMKYETRFVYVPTVGDTVICDDCTR